MTFRGRRLPVYLVGRLDAVDRGCLVNGIFGLRMMHL